jgi:hypothetical protein
MLRLLRTAPFAHSDFARHLNQNKIGNRVLLEATFCANPQSCSCATTDWTRSG